MVESLSCWQKRSQGNLPKTQAFSKTFCYSPQIDSKDPFLKKIPTQLIENKDVELVPTQSLQSYALASRVQDVTMYATNTETQTLSQPQKPLIQNGILPGIYANAMLTQCLWE